MPDKDDSYMLDVVRFYGALTEERYRHVAAQIENRQLSELLSHCASNRAGLVARFEEAIEEVGGEIGIAECATCCSLDSFDLPANDDFATLLDRLAECDEKVSVIINRELDGRKISAMAHLVVDEALILLEETIKKLRRIIEQADGARSDRISI